MTPLKQKAQLVGLCALLSVTMAYAADDKVSVALILGEKANDYSWNQQAYESLVKLQDAGRVEVSLSESVGGDAASAGPVISGYAEKDVNLIIGHGFEFGKPIQRLAPDYGSVNFAWAGGINGTAQNVADYEAPFYEGYYLAGMVAAGLSKSGTIGGTVGFDVPSCHASIEAFRAGAKRINPDIKMLSTVVGSFSDVAKGKQAAIGLADQGADHLMTCGNAPTLGAISAAEERGLGIAGYVGDMSPLAPEHIFVSVIWNMDVLFSAMVDDIMAGTFQPGKYYSLGMKDGTVELAINSAYPIALPDDIRQQVSQAFEDIKGGTFEVPRIDK